MKQYLEAGEFVTTHGILGELKLYPWCDGPEFLCPLKRLFLSPDGKKTLRPERIRAHKNVCIVKLEGVSSPEEARIYIGKTVYIDREDIKLEKGSYFVQDLIGCTVQDLNTEQIYGTIIEVNHPGAHDVYTVKSPSGNAYLFPAVPEFVHSSNLEAGLILVKPIEGMFSEGAKNDDED